MHTIAVVALKEEDPNEDLAGLFSDVLYTGVGKINATLYLTKLLSSLLARGVPFEEIFVMNLGSAGSSYFERGAVVTCDAVVQRDMNCTPIGFKPYVTPFEGEATQALLINQDRNGEDEFGVPTSISHLEFLHPSLTRCYTADSFIEDGNELADIPHVVEMEAYALAKVCRQLGVSFAALKYVSDGSSSEASKEWTDNAPASIPALLDRAKEILSEVSSK